MSYWTSSLVSVILPKPSTTEPDQAVSSPSSYPSPKPSDHFSRVQIIMITGFEALGAASAVLQVISFATDVTVACKVAYDGATTSQDDLQRYVGRMSEAVGRVHTRCEQMSNANSKFASPKLQNIAKECKDAADKLEAEVQYVTSLQAKGDLVKSLRKALRASRHQKKLQVLQQSLSMYRQVVKTELTSHLCSQSDAIYFQQDASFRKLDTDVQFLINQLAEGITDVKDLVKQEHATTRNVLIQEIARSELAINSHTDSQVLELRITVEAEKKCEMFLQSLKAPRMNQRYNDVMDSRDANFNQVFATYKDMRAMYYGDSDGNIIEYGDSKGNESSETTRDLKCMTHMEDIHRSWASFNSWLQSDDEMFYVQGKPGSGKSTLIKFILDQEQTQDLLRRWSPDTIIKSYFFWKIGSEEQNSIKGLWCSLLYQRLQDQQQLVLGALQHFSHLSLHSEYHDWSIKDLQDVWNCIAKLDTRHICMFIDGLDEVRNEDGFSKLAQSIQLISQLPRTKLCISARPEAQIVRWLRTTNADGILLEDLTRFDMLQFVRDRFHQLLPNSQVSSESSQDICRKLVDKAQGVFLWVHLASRSIIDGIENVDSEDMLLARLNALPGDLENLYIDMWQRMNARSPVYQETARRYFRYVLQGPGYPIVMGIGQEEIVFSQPGIVQIACAENLELQEKLLKGTGTIRPTEILRMCEDTTASIHNRCAGLLEVQLEEHWRPVYEMLENNSNPFGKVVFIHRTAHDFLTDTEAGQGILGCGPLSDFSLQTQLLNGLICTAIFLEFALTPSYTSDVIIMQIADFAYRWRNEGLQLATKLLDIVRPLYDRKSIRIYQDLWVPSGPFFSLLNDEDLFNDFVISRLATETSTGLATSVLRRGWAPTPEIRLFKGLSKRLFFALIKLGAIPHEYGALCDPRMQPFARKETAFTNLLMSFIISTKWCEIKHRIRIDDELRRKVLLETLEIAIYMATTCQNLNAVISLFARIPETGPMMLPPFREAIYRLGEPTSPYASVFFEVNIQFLLLYLSKIGGILADCVLAAPQAQDVLSRIDCPLVKIRYFQLPRTEKDTLEQNISSQRAFQRILSPEPLPRRDIEQLFDVDFEGLSQDLRIPHWDKTDLNTITQYIKEVETEEVNVEEMMTSLAAENLGFCTYEEAGITPPYEYLRNARERNHREWMLFPLAMGRLEAAAAIKEGIEGHE
ncbi:hypothetical protein FOPG_12463 [Fusarium oxysporum f. sp. conglutinans race 2 54008]|uniref:Uncharacterized protein n=2 Tax=Fusarium oxysporum f. sp. conglutinans TaxID=100902 RepID=F9FDC8_FUSOF|nr:hypothetical protein FOXB_04406 [Fusarium oxysporum f. sp. conglutinans Fo5176]EXL71913.1 hypothetical protein FOPG_12463 [Fusarium oxysporum f. sp. conglutinans race 2 54008]